jgi:hypothetical protein
MSTFLRALEQKFVDMLDSTGFSEAVGGHAVLDRGLEDLRAGVLPVVAELLQVETRGESLAEAVAEGERYPHLTRVHGWLRDITSMAVPPALLPWVRRVLAMGPTPDDADLQRLLAALAFRSPSPAERALGRLMLFEVLCLDQRLQLAEAGVAVEVIGGQPDDVEALTERELEEVQRRPEYRQALLSLEDPLATLKVLLGSSMASLDAYVEVLRAEVAEVSREMAARLETRQEMLRLLAGVDPTDAVLIRNAHAAAFGDQRLTVEELKVKHPGLLGGVSPAAARKRLERALRRAPGEGRPRPATLGDLLLEQMKEADA